MQSVLRASLRLSSSTHGARRFHSLALAHTLAQSSSPYNNIYQESISSPTEHFGRMARGVHWDRFPSTVFAQQPSTPPSIRPTTASYSWYPDGTLNTCYNALDVHVAAGRGSQVALIHDSPATYSVRKLTYSELLHQVSHFAGVLQARGVAMGDRVLIYMPMVPEAIVAMLACARIGAIHSVVFGGFAAKELAVRVDDCKPKVIVSSSCGIDGQKLIAYKPLLDSALQMARHKPGACIILQRPMQPAELRPDRDLDWTNELSKAQPQPCVPLPSHHPLYVLYTSGTTGTPKGVLRENGPHAVTLKWSMSNIYGLHPGETMFAASDVGWVVGHSYTCYGPLLNGSTTVCFEGKPVGTPDPGTYFRIIQQHKVRVMFTAPTALRAIKKEDPHGSFASRYDISSLKTLFVAGEHCDIDTLHWARQVFKVPVVDHWWQTETGWPVASTCMGIEAFPPKDGSVGKAVPGYALSILSEDGKPLPASTLGEIAIKLPLPPGAATTLYNNQKGYEEAYLQRFPGYYHTGDAGYIDESGYVFVLARTDDVINVAGHRLSTSTLEDVLASHPNIAECAVIGLKDKMKGQVPIGLVVLKKDAAPGHLPDASQQVRAQMEARVCADTVSMVREHVGAFACYKKTIVVDKLPKTRSGKTLRKTLRQMANHEKWTVPATIEDPSVLEVIYELIMKETQ